MYTEEPFFSIITSTLNAEKYLASTIQSVLTQTFSNIEYIIVDGGSTDKTLEIIDKFINDYRIKIISEKDDGIYDAWNKGISISKGKWILFLGADDQLFNNALEEYYNFLNGSPIVYDFVCSKLIIVNERFEPIRAKGCPWNWKEFRYINHLAHPGSIHNLNFFKTYGYYNPKYKIVGDYEILLRAGNKLNAGFLNKFTVLMMDGGISSCFKALDEHKLAITNTGGLNSILAFFYLLFLKSKLFIKSLLKRVFGFDFYFRKAIT